MTRLRTFLLRLWALVRSRQMDRDMDEEIASHLAEATDEYIQQGLSPEDARLAAQRSFGGVTQTKEVYRQVRSFRWLNDLARDVLYAFRTFRRAPLPALVIVATVSLGLGLVGVVFAVYNTLFLRVDAVRDPHELFAVERPAAPGTDALRPLTWLDYDAMRRETSVFVDTFAMVPAGRTRIEGRPVTSTLVTGNFFQVLGVRAALGRTLTAVDDERAASAPVVVLSHAGWNTLFARDPSVVGRTVRINELPYEVVGVMPDEFRGLSLGAPDLWTPLALAGQFREAYAAGRDAMPVEIVGRLKPGVSPEAATAALAVWASARPAPKPAPGIASIALTARQGTLSANVLSQLLIFSPIFFVFGLILVIACANVTNLLLARGVSRQQEIGIRLSLGASRRRIIRQLVTESLLLALAAAVAGVAVLQLFLAGVLRTATTIVPAELWAADITRWAPVADWRVMVFLAGAASVSTAFFGLMPAVRATRLEIARTMRGDLTRDARPGGVRQALIAVQVGASTLLLVCSVIFLRGALSASSVDPGMRTSDTVMLTMANEPRRAALVQAMTAHRSVEAAAAWSQQESLVADTAVSTEGMADTPAQTANRAPVEQMAVSWNYFDLLGIDVVRGRAFTPAERGAEAGVAIVSETAARRLWPTRDALDQIVRFDGRESDSPSAALSSSRRFTIVGIVRDVGGGLQIPDLFGFRGVYLPTSLDSPGASAMLRVRGDPEEARLALLESLTAIDPSLGTIISMRSIARLQAYVMQLAFRVTIVLGGLALVLTLSGLFSLLSYVVEQRARDIGLRMALGATTRHVVESVLSQSLRPVVVGLVAGLLLATALAAALMTTPAAAAIRDVVHVFDPVAYAATLLIIATSCVLSVLAPTMRATQLNPIATLRRD